MNVNVKIYTRGSSYWVYFSFKGKLYRYPMKLKVNKANERLASNKRYELEDMLSKNILPTKEDCIIKKESEKKESIKQSSNLELLDSFMQIGFITNDSYKEHHRFMYYAAYKKFQEVIDTSKLKTKDVSSFHYETFKKYLLNSDLSYNTSRTYISYMNVAFNHAIKTGIYKNSNPFIIPKKKSKLFIRTISDEHRNMIFDYLKKHDEKLYRTIYFFSKTGFRLREATELKWEQIKWQENLIDVYNFKDDRYDLFPLNLENGTLKEFLSSFKKYEGYVFDFNRNYRMVRVWFQQAITEINLEQKKKNKKWVNIPRYNIHDWRRTFGSKYAKQLMPIELMTLMRHKDITTTLKFYISMEIGSIADKLNGKNVKD